jgi:diguanylate cyclase (GGDEF)-like protein
MIDELTEYVRKFREAANTDSLTKLLNRRTFDEVMQRAIELFHEKKIPISLIMLDIDYFKKLNDTYGHSAGDEVLRQFSHILKKNIRVEDSVFRYGGEEFAIVAHGNTKEDIQIFTERILAEVQSTVVKYKKNKIKFTFSAGIEAMQDGLTRQTLIQRADFALYHAKKSGRNQVVCFEEFMLEDLK